MTRAIFYIDIAKPLLFLSEFLYRKIFLVRQTALVCVDDDRLEELDDYLWGRYFLPHVRLRVGNGGVGGDDLSPIVLTSVEPKSDYHADVIINLQSSLPSFFGRFSVYVDIVDNTERGKQKARLRYRYFADHGYSIDCHCLSSS